MASFTLVSLGCAKNQVDSEIMLGALEDLGHVYVPDPAEADLIIVNSCSFINPAKQESIETSLALKDRYPGKKLLLAGCLPQRYADELTGQLTEIDGFFAGRDPRDIVPAAGKLLGPNAAAERQPGKRANPQRPSRRRLLSHAGSAYVKISDGCRNRCAYCAIPLIKGDLHSRARADVVAEIRDLLAQNVFELNIVAQDLGSFGMDRGACEIGDLLADIRRLEGDFWVRLLYVHPDRFPPAILETVQRDSRFLPYFDLPFQHASEKILRAMGRCGSAESYLSLIERIRNTVPRAVIRSTFLVGFPGETEHDFQKLRDFQERARIDWLGIFTYSREEGTEAARFKGQVRSGTAKQRKRDLEAAQTHLAMARMDRFVGQELTCLIEEAVQGEDLFLGRAYLQAPEVDGLTVVRGSELSPGDRLRVRIVRRNGIDLEAVPARRS